MGFFSGLTKAIIDTATLPISIAKSVIDINSPSEHVDKISDDIDEMFDDI